MSPKAAPVTFNRRTMVWFAAIVVMVNGFFPAVWILLTSLKTETELILKSRRVVPGRLLQEGFAFDFPDWPSAAEDLCRRWRAKR